jgi:hypothetical protein
MLMLPITTKELVSDDIVQAADDFFVVVKILFKPRD